VKIAELVAELARYREYFEAYVCKFNSKSVAVSYLAEGDKLLS
jgi:hypothetical protein